MSHQPVDSMHAKPAVPGACDALPRTPSADDGRAVFPTDFVSRPARFGLWVVFLALLTWYATGAFPLGANHGDAIQEAAGVEHIARYGWDGPTLTHNFVGCPGLTTTLVALRKLTGIAPGVLLSAVSLIAGLVYAFAASGLISRLTGMPVPLAGLVLLLSPVALMAGMYPNDLITASAFAMLAMFLLSGPMRLRNHLLGAICLGLAGWYRADAVLITAAIPILLYRGCVKSMLRAALLVAVVSGCLAIGLVYASGSNLKAILMHAEAVATDIAVPARFVAFYLSLFPLIIVYLLVIGISCILRGRHWRVLGITVAGMAPLWYVLFTFPHPKYFIHVAPFLGLIAACGMGAALTCCPPRRRRTHLAVLALLFAGQYLFGLQITLRSKPWRNPPLARVITLYETNIARGPVSSAALVIGSGTTNPFGHAPTPLSGILFTPMNLSRQQELTREFLGECISYMDGLSAPETKLFGSTHEGVQCAIYALVNSGYHCVVKERFGPNKYSWRYVWERGPQRITHYRVFTPEYDATFIRSIGELTGVYVIGSGREETTIGAQASTARLIARAESAETRALYEVVFPPLDMTSNGAPPPPGPVNSE